MEQEGKQEQQHWEGRRRREGESGRWEDLGREVLCHEEQQGM